MLSYSDKEQSISKFHRNHMMQNQCVENIFLFSINWAGFHWGTVFTVLDCIDMHCQFHQGKLIWLRRVLSRVERHWGESHVITSQHMGWTRYAPPVDITRIIANPNIWNHTIPQTGYISTYTNMLALTGERFYIVFRNIVNVIQQVGRCESRSPASCHCTRVT